MERILYIGLDDSNHADASKRAEIITAIFSFKHEDSLRKVWPKQRRKGNALRSMRNPGLDYRFTILDEEVFTHTPYNIPLLAPYLIDNFIEGLVEKPDNIKIYLDGLHTSKHKDLLRESFRGEFPDVVVSHFTKNKGVPNCPRVVDLAHNYANMLINEPSGIVLNDPKRVIVPGEELLKRALKFSEA